MNDKKYHIDHRKVTKRDPFYFFGDFLAYFLVSFPISFLARFPSIGSAYFSRLFLSLLFADHIFFG